MDDEATVIGPADNDPVARGARTMGLLRAAVGIAMIVAPRSVVRPQGDEPSPGNLVFMVRTIGVRDLALGLGTLAAARSSRGRDARRWIQFGLLSDALDTVIGAGSGRLLGRRGAATAALVPAPFVAADLWVLRG
jgi:hypothetical protein